ncbi:hypothetical protein O9992_11890 [Vibrio lentus]|nr:hypothetical protein [Vibrio lentus]
MKPYAANNIRPTRHGGELLYVPTIVRQYLAELGVEKLTDLIGRTDLLEAVQGLTAKQSKLDLFDIGSSGISRRSPTALDRAKRTV